MKKAKINWIFVTVFLLLIGGVLAGTLPFFPSLNPFTGSLQIVSPTDDSQYSFLYYDSEGKVRINWTKINKYMNHTYLTDIKGVDTYTTNVTDNFYGQLENITLAKGDIRVY